jgi:hypothetical protein
LHFLPHVVSNPHIFYHLSLKLPPGASKCRKEGNWKDQSIDTLHIPDSILPCDPPVGHRLTHGRANRKPTPPRQALF